MPDVGPDNIHVFIRQHLGKIDSFLSGNTLADSPGLGILVTCDYKGTLHGTNEDARRMEAVFRHLNYVTGIHNGTAAPGRWILKNENATKDRITRCITEVSNYLESYNGPTEGKTIIFAFSGHGTNVGQCEQIFDNDITPLDILNDIVRHLVKGESCKAAHIPVLFFIDACRGSHELEERVVSTTGKEGGPHADEHYFEKVVNEIYGNFRIDYCTIPAYVSYGPDDGSLWMPKLADAIIKKYDSFQNLAAIVRKQVFQLDIGVKKQQCESVGSLYSGRLYLTKKF